MVSSVIVRTLTHVQFAVPVNFNSTYVCPSNEPLTESFTILNHYIKQKSGCSFSASKFSVALQENIWYNYATSKLSYTIPFVAGLEFYDQTHQFNSGGVQCSIDYTGDKHVLQNGEARVTVLNTNTNTEEWSETLIGNPSPSTACTISLKSLDAALYLKSDGSKIIVIPEERWHNLLSVVFVGIAGMYLIGDVNILKKISGYTLNRIDFKKKLFLIDGPVTAISACASLLMSDATALTPSWLVTQQSIVLFCAVFYVTVSVLILFAGKKNEPVPFGTLRLSVELPILLAIFAPIVGSRGNLVYLSAFLTSVISSLLVFRDTAFIFDRMGFEETNFTVLKIPIKWIHFSIVFVAVFIQAPVLMLSVITEDQLKNIWLRILSAFCISFTVPILALSTSN